MDYKRLHLIERQRLEYKMSEDEGITFSGYWAFSEEEARSFIGCFLFLHLGQTEPARYAGEIIDVIRKDEGEYEGRFVFKVKDEPRLTGVITSPQGWYRWFKSE